jgi:hypothetical protein
MTLAEANGWAGDVRPLIYAPNLVADLGQSVVGVPLWFNVYRREAPTFHLPLQFSGYACASREDADAISASMHPRRLYCIRVTLKRPL